jgi:type IV secretory pathway VirB10-like protein
MTEAAANNASESATSNIAEANSQFVNQVGSGFTSRAMNIQPTLTVDSGSPINIMLNKTLYIPAVVGYPASQRYILE